MIKLLTVKETASILGVSLGSVYALVHSGQLDHRRIGTGRGTIRISEEDLEQYLEDSRVTTPGPRLKYLDV